MNTASDSVNEIRHTDPLIWRQVEVPTGEPQSESACVPAPRLNSAHA